MSTYFYIFISGYKQKVHISGCVIFEIETNACRGYCVSEATPSDYFTRRANSNHIITSRAECCSIKDTVDVSIFLASWPSYLSYLS